MQEDNKAFNVGALTDADRTKIAASYHVLTEYLSNIRVTVVSAHIDRTSEQIKVIPGREAALYGDLTALVNALLNEARNIAVRMGGEKYAYDMFLLCLLGKKRIAEAKDALNTETPSTTPEAADKPASDDPFAELLQRFNGGYRPN